MTDSNSFRVPAGALEQAVAFIRAEFPERSSVAAAVRQQHARGEGLSTALPPDVVVWPTHKDEVCAILRRCN